MSSEYKAGSYPKGSHSVLSDSTVRTVKTNGAGSIIIHT